MLPRNKYLRIWFPTLLVFLGLLAVACGGVSPEDHDALQLELDANIGEAVNLQTQIDQSNSGLTIV